MLPTAWAIIFGVLGAAGSPIIRIRAYEGDVFPEQVYWERLSTGGERSIENGWFVQSAWPGGGQDFYRMGIGSFALGRFFLEWRAVTDNPAWLIDEWQTPASAVAGGTGEATYHTVFTESAAALYRDVAIPRVIPPVSIGSPHVYRLEVFLEEYIWYIDGVVVDQGSPIWPYPGQHAVITWGVQATEVDATTAWDYIRFGTIPLDGSGDFDSDGVITIDFGEYFPSDLYFFHDCLTKDGPGIFGGPQMNAGPGCRFADFNADAAVDLLDFAQFQNLPLVDRP